MNVFLNVHNFSHYVEYNTLLYIQIAHIINILNYQLLMKENQEDSMELDRKSASINLSSTEEQVFTSYQYLSLNEIDWNFNGYLLEEDSFVVLN